jgi:predicted nucleotidyltransferase
LREGGRGYDARWIFPDTDWLFALGRLETELRELLGAPVDLVPISGLKPRVRREVRAEVQPL